MRVKADKQSQQTKAVAIEKVNDENYIVPANEKHLFHCIIEVRKFNAETGERLSKPRVQKFGQKAFEIVLPKLKQQGYTVTILHNPKG